MANPTNSIDLYDKDFATTHALNIGKKEDESGRESLPTEQNAKCGEYWGDFHDDDFLAIRQQGFVPLRYTDATSNATPSAQTFRAVPDGGMIEVEMIAVGKVAANDFVYRKVSRTYERDGATVQEITSTVGTAQYSTGGTLSTATANIVLSSTNVQLEVTGEAATTIAWRLYTKFLEFF